MDRAKIQEILVKKQKMMQRALKELQTGKMEESIKWINIESGFNIDLIKEIEKGIKND